MLIAFDGIDGVGKTTQIIKLQENLGARNIKCYMFDMGGFHTIGNHIKALKHKKYNCSAQLRELLYYFEGNLFTTYYEEELKKKYDVVLCDRWLLTYYAYGMNNGLEYKEIEYFTKKIRQPDLSFYFDLNPQTALKRITKYRGLDQAEVGYGNDLTGNRKEDENTFLLNQEKIRANFKNVIVKKNCQIKMIDSEKSEEIIEEEILKTVLLTLKKKEV